MKIIEKYVLREFLKIFCLILLALISIYLLVDFFERIDDLVEHHAPLSSIFQFFLLKVPLIIYTVLPFSILFSTILSLGILSRHMEITAMRASGISYLSIVKPILLSSLFISVITFSINETISPDTNRKVRELKDRWIDGNLQNSIFRQHKVWLRGEEGFFNVSLIEPEKGILQGFTLFRLNKDFSIASRTDASMASWKGSHWNLRDVMVTNFSKDGAVEILSYPEKSIELSKSLKDFQRLEMKADEMGFMELRRYIDRLHRDGYSGIRYMVNLYSKVSFPFGSFIMAIIGMPLAAIRMEKGGVTAGIVLSIIVGFIYWVVASVTMSLGYSGFFPPLLAAWTPNLTFGVLGVLMYTYIE